MALRNPLLNLAALVLLTACSGSPVKQPTQAQPATQPEASAPEPPATLLAAAQPVTGIEVINLPPTDLWEVLRKNLDLSPQADNRRLKVQRS